MSVEWLQDLEEKVREASKRLAELRKENAALKARVEELEAEAEGTGDAEGAAAWEEEKAEIQGRVTKLAEHLEKLLED